MEKRLDAILPAGRRFVTAGEFERDLQILRAFKDWCVENHHPFASIPWEGPVEYFAERARCGAAISTLERERRVLSRFYSTAGQWDSVAVARLSRRLRDLIHELSLVERPKLPLTRRLVEKLRRAPDGSLELARVRDAAILLLCFHAGLTPGEFANLSADAITITEEKLALNLPATRTTAPALLTFAASSFPSLHAAVKTWIQAGQIMSKGPLFYSLSLRAKAGRRGLAEDHLRKLLHRRLQSSGLDPSRFDGTSFFKGFVSSKLQAGLSCEEVAKLRAIPVHRVNRVCGMLSPRSGSQGQCSTDDG